MYRSSRGNAWKADWRRQKEHTTYSTTSKFYVFEQYDRGYGCYEDQSRGISHWVVIEALSHDEANEKASDIGLMFDDNFNGNRYKLMTDQDGTRWPYCGKGTLVRPEEPWIGPRTRENGKWAEGPEGWIHYMDNFRVSSFYH